MNFQRFIRKHIPGLRVLNLSLESYLPGSVLHPKTLRRLGHVRDLLSGNDAEWETQLSQASMVYGQIEHSRKARAGISILGILKIGGGGGSDLTVDYTVTDVRGSEFVRQSQLTLHPRLNELRQSSPVHWTQINDQFVVTESFYAKEFTARFRRAGQVVGEVELSGVVRVPVSGELASEWRHGEELVISNNLAVPFGVRGFRV